MSATLFLALAMLGFPVQAQVQGQMQVPAPTAAADQTSPTVVVTGRRASREKALRHMTSVVTPVVDAGRPLARFQTPICPQVDGLTAALNGAFADRIRADARIAGLEASGAACSPNLTVLIVPDGQAVVRELHRTRSAVFGQLDPVTIRHLAAQPGPAHLWTITEVRSRDGDRIRGGGGGGNDVGILNVRNASILQAVTRTDVNGTVLLLDQPATVGKTINQLADYAAMRTIAQTRPIGDAASEPTILTLFDGGAAPPRGLTPFDTAYLQALYHGSAEYRPVTQVGIMNRAINKSLSRAPADGGEPAAGAVK